MKNLKVKFLRTYCNIPINIRSEIILVLKDHGPITWQVAYFEVNGDTEISKEILKSLDKLKFI